MPLLTRKRGDSGTNQIRKNWKMEGMAWRREGIRHDQLLLILAVPNEDHEALYRVYAVRCETDKAAERHVHDVTGVPEGVVERTELWAVDGIRHLRDQHGSGVC